MRTRARIARVIVLGSLIGAAVSFYQAPHDPKLFWNVVALTFLSFYAVSRYRHEEKSISEREALAVYLSVPATAMVYYYDSNAVTALWVVASVLWAVVTRVSRDLRA